MYFQKKSLEETPEENTTIWSCTKEGCKGWMRDNFAFAVEPTCPLCSSSMTSDTKMLPLIVNYNEDQKTVKKSTKIQ